MRQTGKKMENRLWKKNATGDALCISRTVNMSNGIYPPSALSPAKLKLLGPTRTPKNNSGPANHHKKIASTDSDSLESHFMWYIQTLAFSYGFYCVFCVPTFIAPHIREPALMAANQWGTHGHQGLCSRAFSKKWLCNISLFGPSKYRPTQIANPQKDYKSTKNLAKKTEDKICGNHKTTTATSKHIKKHQNLF